MLCKVCSETDGEGERIFFALFCAFCGEEGFDRFLLNAIGRASTILESLERWISLGVLIDSRVVISLTETTSVVLSKTTT